MAVPLGPQGNKRCKKIADCGGLLPGILNDITLSLIAPKLSWRDVRSLSLVNRGWWHAIRSREVYNARLRLHSTETLVLFTYYSFEHNRAIGLYSMRENCCYQLPLIPRVDGRSLSGSQWVSLDGKIYVLGGEFWPGSDNEPFIGNVYVLDLAGQRPWKQCASMITPRGNFGCGVVNGKLYVFGGWVCGETVCGSEVYDPEGDTWSPIKAMTDLRFDHNVTTLGAKLLVHSGYVLEPKDYQRVCRRTANRSRTNCLRSVRGGTQRYYFRRSIIIARPVETHKFFLVYDAVKDEWSVLEARRRHRADVSFIKQGKLHSMSSDDIHVLDLETNSWTHLHSHSFAACELRNILVQGVLAAGDHLLATIEAADLSGQFRKRHLLRSRGLGSTNKQIEWEEIRLPPHLEWHFMDTVAPAESSIHQIQL